jgi:hypothetical protein
MTAVLSRPQGQVRTLTPPGPMSNPATMSAIPQMTWPRTMPKIPAMTSTAATSHKSVYMTETYPAISEACGNRKRRIH